MVHLIIQLFVELADLLLVLLALLLRDAHHDGGVAIVQHGNLLHGLQTHSARAQLLRFRDVLTWGRERETGRGS